MPKSNTFLPKSSTSEIVIVAAITVLFLAVELTIGSGIFIWLDEAFTLYSTGSGVQQSIARAVIFEGQPPVYFFLLSLWRMVDDSYWFARLFSILFATVSIPVFFGYVRKYYNQTSVTLLTLFFAFNPMTLWTGLEIRVYAMVIFFSVLLMWLFQATYTKSKTIIWRRAIFIIVSLLAIHTHYYFSFVLLINAVFLLFNNRNNLFRYIVDMIIPAGSLIVYIFYLSNQVDVHSVTNATNTLTNFIMFWFYMLRAYVFPFPKIFDNNNINALFFLISVVSLVLILWQNRNLLSKYYSREWSYPVVLIISLSIIFTGLFFTLGEAAISPRHALFILAPLMVVLASSLLILPNKRVKLPMVGLILILFVVNVFAKAPDYGKDQAILKVHEAIEADKNSASPKLFYFGENALVYSFLSVDSAIYSIPAKIDLTVKYEHRDWFIKNTVQLATFFESFNTADTLWIIDSSPDTIGIAFMQNRFGVNVNYQLLDNYIIDNYNVISTLSIDNKYRLRKVTKNEPECAE